MGARARRPAKELERSTALGVGAVCFHPGAATGGDRTEAHRARGRERHRPRARGGAGEHPHSRREHRRRRADHGAHGGGGRRDPRRTCPPRCARAPATGSTPATSTPAGHDIRARGAASRRCSTQFEAAPPVSRPSFFHLNDSEGALGSNKDRHLLIGDGRIGVEPFRWLLADRANARRPADPRDPAAALRHRRGRPFARPVRRPDDGAPRLVFVTVLISTGGALAGARILL